MANKVKKLTITVPEELKPILNKVKQEHFYNDSQSEMIRQLIIKALKERKELQS